VILPASNQEEEVKASKGMSTACIPVPINEIRDSGQRGVRLCQHRNVNPWTKAKLYLFIPRVLRFINHSLSRERLAALDRNQTASMYRSLVPLHDEVAKLIDAYPLKPLAVRILTKWWIRSIEVEYERLVDLVESLAWGSDSALRRFAATSVEAIERRAK
jgi:hypothetical protein